MRLWVMMLTSDSRWRITNEARCVFCPMSWCLSCRSWCAAALTLLTMRMKLGFQGHMNAERAHLDIHFRVYLLVINLVLILICGKKWLSYEQNKIWQPWIWVISFAKILGYSVSCKGNAIEVSVTSGADFCMDITKFSLQRRTTLIWRGISAYV
jgi:hypothetical protein